MRWRLIIVYTFNIILSSVDSDDGSKKPLRGQHLRVLPVEVPPTLVVNRAANGTVLSVEGFSADLLEWISKSLEFTYSINHIDQGVVFEDSKNGRGWKNIVYNKEVELVIGPLALIAARQAYLDYSYPDFMTYYEMLIPAPELSSNFGAPWKPYSPNAWILLLLSTLATATALTVISRYIFKFSATERASHYDHYYRTPRRAADYVLQVLLNQGNYCPSRRLPVRLLAGVWCLASFFLVYFYSSVLISFISASNKVPVIEKLTDLPSKPEVRVVTNYGWSADAILSTSQSGVLKYMGDMLNRDPSLRCPSTAQCVEKVKSGSFIFVSVREPNLNIMERDVRETKHCHFTVAKERFLPQLLGYAFPKNSPHRTLIDNRILAVWETGLLDYWNVKVPPIVRKCLKTTESPEKVTLGMRHLSSAFILLIAGYSLAVFVFFFENVFGRRRPSVTVL